MSLFVNCLTVREHFVVLNPNENTEAREGTKPRDRIPTNAEVLLPRWFIFDAKLNHRKTNYLMNSRA